MPIYSVCLSSPPVQALKCLVKFTEARHLLDRSWGRGPMSKFSLSHLIKSRGTRREYKESRGMIYNAILGRVRRKMSSRTSKLRCCSEVNNGHLRDVFTSARRTIINDFFKLQKSPARYTPPSGSNKSPQKGFIILNRFHR